MFSSAAFAQNCPEIVSEGSDEMAAKRARIEPTAQAFDKIDVDSLSVKVVEMKDDPMYLTVYNHQEVQVIMHPDEPAVILRGFDMFGEKEQTKLNSNVPGAKGTRLSLYVTMDEAQVKFLGAASEKIRESFASEEGVEWHSPLPKKKPGYENDAVSTKVVLEGKPGSLTTLKIKNGDVAAAGEGWEFLQQQVARNRAYAFTGAEMKAVIKLRPWKKDGKAGLELVATQLALKVVERKFVDLLPDW
jgi:hypothetical protein